MSTLRATLTDSKTKEITLDGDILGTVEPMLPSRWHSSFRPFGGDSGSLIQGFGDTPEEAISNGFSYTISSMEKSLSLVKKLKSAMYSE